MGGTTLSVISLKKKVSLKKEFGASRLRYDSLHMSYFLSSYAVYAPPWETNR